MSAGTVAHANVITDRGKMGSAPLGYGQEALRAQESVPADATTLAVSLDRLMAPMKNGARQAKRAATSPAGRPTKGTGRLSGRALRHGVILRLRGTAVDGNQEGNAETAPRPEVGQAGRRGTRQLDPSG